MAGQTQKSKAASKVEEEVVETEAATDLKDEELAEDVDDLLADIDDVLEENAAEFVQSFVQKGGQ